MTATLSRFGLRLVLPAALVVLWWVLTADSNSVFYPPLPDILTTFRKEWLFSHLGSDALPSLFRMYAGFAMAAVTGVALGVVLGSSRLLRSAALPVIQFAQALPGTAMVLVFLVLFGPSDTGKVFLIASASLWPVLYNTMAGVQATNPTLVDVARSYRLTWWQRVIWVSVPAAGAQIAAGMRTSVGVAFIVMIASEFLGGSNGIGYFTLGAATIIQMPEMWSGVILLAVLGVGSNALFGVAERRALRWYHGERQVVTAMSHAGGA
jgi:ABC-type nitrate/sulfonate/bicarbonate transport system permease component